MEAMLVLILIAALGLLSQIGGADTRSLDLPHGR
jgi:hypothetical protein